MLPASAKVRGVAADKPLPVRESAEVEKIATHSDTHLESNSNRRCMIFNFFFAGRF